MELDYKSIFEKSPDLCVVLDKALRIVAASDAYLDALGLARAGLAGRFFFDVFPPRQGSAGQAFDARAASALHSLRASFERVLQTGSADALAPQRHDLRPPAGQGGGLQVRYWRPVTLPIVGTDGATACLLHRLENATEFVQLQTQQAQQEHLSDELLARTTQMQADLWARSREVSQASVQLRQANAGLQALYAESVALDTLKNEFFANVSHELRTPLTLILGPLEQLLAQPDLPLAQRRALSVMQRNARLLQRQVGNLLDLAKLEAGHLQLEYSACNLAALVRLTASHFEAAAAERRMALQIDAPASLPAALDTRKVESMVLNLLANAFRFTPDGGTVRVRVRVRGAQVVIDVEDSGPGVPEALREAIFERFTQAPAGAQNAHGGTGLGLAIVRQFAQLHGGSVRAGASSLGGAHFELALARQAPAGAQVGAAALPAAGGAAQAGALAPSAPPGPAAAHVLIIEDHLEMNAYLAGALAPHYRISRAFDGAQGLKLALLPDRPDLIVSDMMMPGLRGDALVQALRQERALEDVPIVIVTAKSDEALRARLLEHGGVQDYLQKPFSVAELLARVHGLLASRRRAAGRLRQSEAHYRTLFDSIDEGFCIIEVLFDADGRAVDYLFLESNPSFEKQTGMKDVQGKRMREFVPDQDAHWFEIYGQVALTGQALRFENESKPLGRWFDVYAFRYGEPESRQVALLFTDVTARRRSEEALREAERRKDQFLSLLAHELRNPLAPIRNAVKIMRLSPAADAAPLGRLLPMMERQLAHMARLLDDLLDVSRIANGKIELRCQPIDVAQAVQAAVEANQPLIDSMGHRIAVALPPGPLGLQADLARLTQVVSNLVHNAATHSPPGARIEVEVQRQGDEAIVCVRDDGAGIDPADLERIFELFAQAGTPFSRSQGGLGIGLSLVRTLVGLHGGRIQARSAGLGRGSEFTVWLPLPDALPFPPPPPGGAPKAAP